MPYSQHNPFLFLQAPEDRTARQFKFIYPSQTDIFLPRFSDNPSLVTLSFADGLLIKHISCCLVAGEGRLQGLKVIWRRWTDTRWKWIKTLPLTSLFCAERQLWICQRSRWIPAICPVFAARLMYLVSTATYCFRNCLVLPRNCLVLPRNSCLVLPRNCLVTA